MDSPHIDDWTFDILPRRRDGGRTDDGIIFYTEEPLYDKGHHNGSEGRTQIMDTSQITVVSAL